MPLIPFAPHKSDLDNSDYTGPFDKQFSYSNETVTALTGFNRHLLGTGKRGEDLLAGLIHGTRVSLTIGLISMAIAGFIGILLGSLAGYAGDHQVKLNRATVLMLLIGILPAWFYGFQMRNFILMDSLDRSPITFVFELLLSFIIFIVVLILFYLSGNLLKWIPGMKKKMALPVDSIISRTIEILISLPTLILIISIAAIARPSLVNLVLIIGLTSWTEFARLTRAEILRVKNLDYIQSARSMGFKESRILLKHALPNSIAPAMVAMAFGVASAILAESSLSFLGIGVPQDMVTWGSLLASGRENFQAWWLVVFPGLAIFLTVTSYNLIGDGLRDLLDPRLRK
jgi:peptide/nickel transport system permease protein